MSEPLQETEFGQEIKIDQPITQRDKDGNVTNYKVFFSETEGTTIRAVDVSGQLKPNVPPIYKDGVYDMSQITSNLNLFVPSDQRWNGPEMENIHREIQTKVKAHINAVAPDIV